MPTTSDQRPADPNPPRRLRPGRHGLPAEVVQGHQRQRIVAAMAITCAASGYAATSIGDIVASAAVSRKTFYEFFDNKEQCLLGAHDDYCARLFEAIDKSCMPAAAWPERVRAALRAALRFLAADLAATQLLTITIVSAGRDGARRYHAMIDTLATRLRDGTPVPLAPRHPNAEWGAVAIISVMVCKAAIQDDPEAILAFEDDFTAMLLALPISS